MQPAQSPLPYRDTKSVGASDFYFVINATFRFILEKAGLEGLRAYWKDLGTGYFANVSKRWADGGLGAVADYWRSFFAAEPEADVEVSETGGSVEVRVKVCPAIAHLRKHHREIVPCFCQHCYFISEAMAKPAGLTVRVIGGNGSCSQVFRGRDSAAGEQDLQAILEAKC